MIVILSVKERNVASMGKNRSIFVVAGVFLMVLFNSVIYGALNTNMFIDGDAYVRVDREVRVTSIKVLEQTNGAYETYNCDYSKDTTSIQATLPSSDSSIVYEVTITNKGDIDYEVSNIVEESYSNSNIKYEIFDLEKGTVIDRETIYTFKIKLTTTENNSENKGTLVFKYTFEEWVPSLYDMVAHKSKSLDTDIDFNVVPTKETSGVYEMDSTKDDKYPVYYYRGIVENNNVSFAGFCWKAVRTTSTGGVKLIYNGVPASDGSCDNTGTASQIGTSAFNIKYTSMEDVSYMYDNGSDSTIKGVIDKWYLDNMVEYTGMLEDTIWCNDRSVGSVSNGLTFFGPNARVRIEPYKPDITCKEQKDSFTVSNDNGNSNLTYPVAMLTTDEFALSGWNANGVLSYLLTNEWWWLLSPHYYGYGSSYGGRVPSGNSTTSINDVRSNIGVRPSISIVSGTMTRSGNGSVFNPYKLVEDKIQKEWAFDYTGGEQEFKVPYDGVYELETWGAQGGNSTKSETYRGGYGAYSTGMISLSRTQNLYINVGGQGGHVEAINTIIEGGYNGGGAGSNEGKYTVFDTSTGSGGGASHIATRTGLLSSFSESLSSILVVAGGGGGGCWYNTGSIGYNSGTGGNAGGIIGSNTTNLGAHTSTYNRVGVGGTQAEGKCVAYRPAYCSSFGVGGSVKDGGAGGGSGYYGGSGGEETGGGGGSSYIGNSLLSDKVMYCYNCQESNEESTKTISTTNVSEKPVSNYAKKGNGYAKITLVEKK